MCVSTNFSSFLITQNYSLRNHSADCQHLYSHLIIHPFPFSLPWYINIFFNFIFWIQDCQIKLNKILKSQKCWNNSNVLEAVAFRKHYVYYYWLQNVATYLEISKLYQSLIEAIHYILHQINIIFNKQKYITTKLYLATFISKLYGISQCSVFKLHFS